MADYFSSAENERGIECNPLYIETELLLAKCDDNNDPLGYLASPEKIDWLAVRDNCVKLSGERFDLRVQLWLLRAGLNTQNGSLLFDTVKTIEHYLSDLSVAEGVDEQELLSSGSCATALSWLSSSQCFQLMKNSRLIPESTFSYEDIVTTGPAPGRSETGYSQLVSEISRANNWYRLAGMPELEEQLLLIHRSVTNIEFLVNDNPAPYKLDCHVLREWLEELSRKLGPLTGGVGEKLTDIGMPRGDEPAIKMIDFNNRRDVIVILDKVIEYFERFEPGHPAPLLIRRSKKMIGMDFSSIIDDMLPESMASLQLYIGKSSQG